MGFHDTTVPGKSCRPMIKTLGPEERITARPASNDPLHGITLAMMLDELVAVYGWEEMGRTIRIRCFTHKPSISSSLEFLERLRGPGKKWKIGIG